MQDIENEIPLSSKRTVPYTPPSLREKHSHIVFQIRVPTFEGRDEVGQLVYRMGVRHIPTNQVQTTLISELYEMLDEEKAEEAAIFLEGHWLNVESERQEAEAWVRQEQQRQLDMQKITDPKLWPAMKPTPENITRPRDRARASSLTNLVAENSRVFRELISEQTLFDRRYAIAMARLFIADAQGDPGFALEFDHGVLTKDSIENIRGIIEPLAGSNKAWLELSGAITNMAELSETERGNLDSPPGSSLAASGSPTSSEGLEPSDGKIPTTDSNTGQIPDGGSPSTTATSSGSSRAREARTGRKRGQTAARS